ncbi:MAG TPA: hypothetical protein VHX52_02350 [Steroidobacteraceae bacterium]|nr:hypothetical protein [Steroidobacteraceae bacterium]
MALAALAALAGARAVPVQAADAIIAPHVMSWSELGALPDFTTGIWEVHLGPGALAQAVQPSLTPAYQARAKAYTAAQATGENQDSPGADCLPNGMPGIMGQPYPMQILFGPREVTIDIEAFMQVRHIYTDGRPHPDDPDPTFNGNSIGHWEGGTLVVDSVGFVPITPLGFNWGVHHSSKMHIVERFHLTTPDMLQVETRVYDPEALTKPWVTSRLFERHASWTIAEYICEQNNRNEADQNGRAGIVLTPPK